MTPKVGLINDIFALMIKITLNTLPLDGNLASQFANTKLNQAAETYVKTLETFTKGKVCSLHPRMNQEITVSTEQTRKFTVVKNNFAATSFLIPLILLNCNNNRTGHHNSIT